MQMTSDKPGWLAADVPSSDCFVSFGFQDFDLERVRKHARLCPVRGCVAEVREISNGRSKLPYCGSHGLRLHSNTFVYWNGIEESRRAQLRNFVMRPDLAEAVILGSTEKAETEYLGHETSEDALTWNVLVGLAEAGRLHELVGFLTDLKIDREPLLYLWGELVDIRGAAKGRFAPLEVVRSRLEGDITRYRTEPDIMLVLPGDLVICVEAKFCSGNPLASDRSTGPGEKPADHHGILRRYLEPASLATRAAIDSTGVGPLFHTQLFRNIVFASEMAKGAEWRVANLVSETQWRGAAESDQYSFVDPSLAVRSLLASAAKDRFHFRSWEALHQLLVAGAPDLRDLDVYFQTKSARYRPAFQLGGKASH